MFFASLQQVWTLTICLYMTQVLCAYTIPAMIFMIRWQESPVLALKCFFPLQLLSAGVEHFMGKAGPMVKLSWSWSMVKPMVFSLAGRPAKHWVLVRSP